MKLAKSCFVILSALFALSCNDPKAKAREDIQNLQETVKYTPNNPKLFTRLGAAYASLGEYEKAIGAFQKAIELNPTDTSTLVTLGVMAFQLERYADALWAFEKLAALTPQSFDAHRNIGNVYVKMKKFREAIAPYQRALALDSLNAEAYFSLGVCYYELGERDSAMMCYERIKDKKRLSCWRLATQTCPEITFTWSRSAQGTSKRNHRLAPEKGMHFFVSLAFQKKLRL
ncbi:MAG: hypothetical protein CMR00_05220 [[Chlorobium] sp. 445]|nr:MAG: hypothetical protein CMR00_05220 [[Chlorobium] sp. 445]